MSSLRGKLETEVEITAPADKFYYMFKREAHQIPKTSQTGTITGVAVLEEKKETEESVHSWSYSIEGDVGTFKKKMEFDEANKTVTVTGLDGELFQYYKSIKGIYRFIQKGDGSSSAKLTLEYEKLSKEIATPHKYIRLMTNIVKDIDSYFIKA